MNEPVGEGNLVGRHLDVTDLDGDPADAHEAPSANGVHRVWVGVYYECCAAYSRVYRRADEMCYRGRCPECGAAVSIQVGPKGIRARMLIASPI
ncbi:MAG: hypothetical protein H6819_07295 [Phycisphaerales bacterium]|nr:hypothetical protein [Phycisphaerales bacterium]MCB9857700.1 hypothetical protein [Phycisphaerales bacterium]MCB9864789.1 hypothetical protein [Phycisphaerales bacterium]